MNINQWVSSVKMFNKRFADNLEVRQEWDNNTKDNLELFNKNNSIWNLDAKYMGNNEKAFFLVGGSPSLKRDVHALKDLKPHCKIMCANSPMKYLLREGIKPDYVISLDSDKLDIPQHLEYDGDDITLLASSVTHRSVLDKWKGPIYFMPYYSISNDLKPKLRNKLGKKVAGGGNTMTQALVIVTLIFGVKIVVFVGNEYCFDESYYADKTSAKQEILETLYPETDVLGKKRWTLPALYQYAIWTEKICSDLTPPGFFIDTSFGLLGKDAPAIYNKDIKDTIRLIDNIFENKKEGSKISTLRIDKHDESKVLRYDVSLQREKLLRLARG